MPKLDYYTAISPSVHENFLRFVSAGGDHFPGPSLFHHEVLPQSKKTRSEETKADLVNRLANNTLLSSD